jgi:hypothetical protein
MTLDRSYIGYLGFLGIDLYKSVLMYSNGTICLFKLLFKMGLFTVRAHNQGALIGAAVKIDSYRIEPNGSEFHLATGNSNVIA